ncbi:MAG: O-antigen ligase family protein [Minisyncoccia bacterium]
MTILIKICLWLLAFVPLIVDNSVFYPYTTGKNLLIETSLVLASILFMINYFYDRSFRETVVQRVVVYIKNPIVISLFSFIFIFIISTIFAVDKYSAFWGNMERAEGLVGTTFFFAFFVFSLLIFEKNDWQWFFKLSLLVGTILLFQEFKEFFWDGNTRPDSFTGNPTFLAGYLLFVITACIFALSEFKSKFFCNLNDTLIIRQNFDEGRNQKKHFSLDHVKNQPRQIFWILFAISIILLSFIGIFLTQTRGALLGLGLGIVAILFYFSFKGKSVIYKKINLQQISISLLCIIIIFSGTFIITRESQVWQNVPGLSRLAKIKTTQDSTAVRLSLYQNGLKAVKPLENGWKKFFIGWGPDNFIIADSKYSDASQYKYEQKWFDRAHNKFLDVTVDNGILGLLTYLSIWFFFFMFILKRNGFSIVDVGLLFLGLSFLTHLMFSFNEISTSIPFFALLAFSIHLPICHSRAGGNPGFIISHIFPKYYRYLIITTLVSLVLFSSYVFFRNTLPSYIQMRDYVSIVKNGDPIYIEKGIDSILSPLTTAQMVIRVDFLRIANDYYSKTPNEISTRLLEKSIKKAEDYLIERPNDFGFMTTLADTYNHKIVFSKNPHALKRGEELFNIILSYAPSRPDIIRGLAVNLFYQEKFDESFGYFEKAFDFSPSYFDKDKSVVEGIYTRFIQYFYEIKDKENFTKVANRLKLNSYEGSSSLDQIVNYLNDTGSWPVVKFE